MVKPDGVLRNLVEEVSNRIKKSGLVITKSRFADITPDEAKRLYKVHEKKIFYAGLLKFITSGPVFLMKIEGEDAIANLRELMGATDPREAKPGTIRGDLKEENIFTENGSIKNIIHGSDCRENAEYELSIFFK